MKSKQINQTPRTWAVIFDTGDEVVAGLTRFAERQGLSASQLSAIGAFSEVRLGYFDFEIRDYREIPVNEQVEVLSLVGDIALKDGHPQLHAHVVLGKSDGTAHGGHLLSAKVRPTLEVVLVESPAHLRREMDESTGLALIRLTNP
jgi:predicted DNA-binding protein with PD1-like motif